MTTASTKTELAAKERKEETTQVHSEKILHALKLIHALLKRSIHQLLTVQRAHTRIVKTREMNFRNGLVLFLLCMLQLLTLIFLHGSQFEDEVFLLQFLVL